MNEKETDLLVNKILPALVKSAYVAGVLDDGIVNKEHLQKELDFAMSFMMNYLEKINTQPSQFKQLEV